MPMPPPFPCVEEPGSSAGFLLTQASVASHFVLPEHNSLGSGEWGIVGLGVFVCVCVCVLEVLADRMDARDFVLSGSYIKYSVIQHLLCPTQIPLLSYQQECGAKWDLLVIIIFPSYNKH